MYIIDAIGSTVHGLPCELIDTLKHVTPGTVAVRLLEGRRQPYRCPDWRPGDVIHVWPAELTRVEGGEPCKR